MHISVLDPIGRAIERTSQILFKPFDIGKWFTMGFCAFLAYLGEGGGGSPGNFFTGRGGPGGRGGPARIGPWIQANLSLIIACAILGLALIIGLGALFTWIRSRGKFMFLDGIVRNHGAVVEPWRTFRPLGNSLFGFSFLLGLLGMFAVLIVVAIGAGLAWPDIRAGRFGTDAWIAVTVGGLLFLVTIFILMVINFLLEDFVIPAMYLRDQRVLEAWATVRHEILPGNLWPIVLFLPDEDRPGDRDCDDRRTGDLRHLLSGRAAISGERDPAAADRLRPLLHALLRRAVRSAVAVFRTRWLAAALCHLRL